VFFGSRKYYSYLARARYIVVNTHLPHWIIRRNGQYIVQTWHGTPLKKLVHDVERSNFVWRSLQNKVKKEVRSWSILISPNQFTSDALRSAFRYRGEIAETGYPRNDILNDANRASIEPKVRSTLGLPEDRKILLYAPTFRDDQLYGPGRYRFANPLDTKMLQDSLSDRYILLVRNHYNVVDEIANAGNGFVWDVSKYPSVEELLISADVLITDYSSLMFDFAHLSRPMVFYVDDIEHYRDELRGFYFNFETDAPGPLVKDTASLIRVLDSLDDTNSLYRHRLTKFQQRFAQSNDGKSASRVVDLILARSTAA